MNILITGGAGYIGSVVSQLLLSLGHSVIAVDTLWFKKDIPDLFRDVPNYKFIRASFSDKQIVDTIVREKIDYVVHTAAVVGEPASNKFPELTQMTNYALTIDFINKIYERGVEGFIFFSTCSNYGISDGAATEDSDLKPLSLYARSKVEVEDYLLKETRNNNWVICRLSTVYGVSPRMRFDLTVNDFTLNAYRNKAIDIFLPFSFRPYIHVYDVARVISQMIKSFEKVKGQVFNLGFEGQNYQKIKIAETIKKFIPELRIEIVKEGADLRDYRVDFSKLKKYLDMRNEYTIDRSIQEIIDLLKTGVISNPLDRIYYNTHPDLEEDFTLKT